MTNTFSTPQQPPTTGWDKTLLTLIFLFGAAVFLWKPGMYLLSLAFGVYFVSRFVMDSHYRDQARDAQVIKYSSSLFFFGVVLALIALQQAEDFFWFFRKTLFFLLIPPLYLTFKEERFWITGFLGTTLGFTIAVVITVDENWGAFGNPRVTGTWPASMWDTLIAMYCLFLLLIIPSTKGLNLLKLALFLNAAIAFNFVILAGGRATWIALFVAGLGYLLLHNRRAIPSLLLTISIGASAIFWLTKERAPQLVERVSSITDTQVDESNWVRLRLWELTLQHLTHCAKNEPNKLFFGAGSETYLAEHKNFYPQADLSIADRARLNESGYPTGDPHNSYLDAVARSGLIWLCALLAFFALLARYIDKPQRLGRAAFIFAYFLVVAFFYSLIPSFAMFFLVWFMLLASHIKVAKDYFGYDEKFPR